MDAQLVDRARRLITVRTIDSVLTRRWGLALSIDLGDDADTRGVPILVSGIVIGRLRALGDLDAADRHTVQTLLEEAAAAVGELADAEGVHLPPPAAERERYGQIIGRSRVMQQLYHILDKVIASDSTVLIQGENGTGKELVARAVHSGSARARRAFVVQNCSAFNENLLDSELFGHKRGSFTGAIADKPGLFQVADTGTFFLDEIGDMSPSLQVKVLRVLQEGTFTAVGDTEVKTVDVRIIAATNRDLRTMVDRGEFREDLYYRVNVINLVVPPLRERIGDIELLTEYFLARHDDGPRKELAPECREVLDRYPWPGNVRELENEIERAVVLSGDSHTIGANLLSRRIVEHTGPQLTSSSNPRSLPAALRSLERRMILDALRRNSWNKTRAAKDLEISRRNLIRLVQKYELESERM
jgi:transcriptional regulator with PAS, ATPase and Fis domain